MYDTIIIGAGPTGLTAAIYASRRMMKILVISKNIGGQVIWASKIENFPGHKSIHGIELIKNINQQVKDLGVEIKVSEVKKINKDFNGRFIIETSNNVYQTKTIIIAIGLEPKTLNLSNEQELVGKGISYCANCDGLFFKYKTVAIVGGGNAALDAAEVMSKIAKNVYLVYKKSKLKGFESLVLNVQNKNNINILLDSEIYEITGKQKLEKIKIKNSIDQTIKELNVDGLFIEIGYEPKTELVANLVERDSKGQIIVDLSGKTSVDGIFAAGDITQNEFKQIIIGCGSGATAALAAYKYLQEKNLINNG